MLNEQEYYSTYGDAKTISIRQELKKIKNFYPEWRGIKFRKVQIRR